MKILVLSDSHHDLTYMRRAIALERPNLVFHLGDHIRDAEDLSMEFQTIPIHRVTGNCDYAPYGRETIVEEQEGVRFFLTHGHRYGVKSSLLPLSLAAREACAQVAVFGHTHHPLCEEYAQITLLNPGSCGGYRPTYGVITVNNGKADCRLKTFDELE